MTIYELLDYIQRGPIAGDKPRALSAAQEDLEGIEYPWVTREQIETHKKEETDDALLPISSAQDDGNDTDGAEYPWVTRAQIKAMQEDDALEVQADEGDEADEAEGDILEDDAYFDLQTAPQSEKEVFRAVACYLNNRWYSATDYNEETARLNIPDENGYSLLLWAIRKKYETVVQLLVEQGASIDAVTRQGPAIVYAASLEHWSIVTWLLSYGNAKVDTTDAHGESALTWATRLGNYTMAERLIMDHGATIKDWTLWETQMESYFNGIGDCSEYTQAIDRADVEEMFRAAQQKNTQTVDFSYASLSSDEFDLEYRDRGYTPMADVVRSALPGPSLSSLSSGTQASKTQYSFVDIEFPLEMPPTDTHTSTADKSTCSL